MSVSPVFGQVVIVRPFGGTSWKNAGEISGESAMSHAVGSVTGQSDRSEDPPQTCGALDAAADWNVVFGVANLFIFNVVIVLGGFLRESGLLRRLSTSGTAGRTSHDGWSRHPSEDVEDFGRWKIVEKVLKGGVEKFFKVLA